MSKINSTFNAGYYMDKEVDWAAFSKEQERQTKQKDKERRSRLLKMAERASGEKNEDAMDGVVLSGSRLRQTFAVPFHCQCLHCNKRIAKGTHVYMNRYKAQTEGEGKSSLGLTVWEIQFRCTSCSKHVYIRTDYDTPEETGGYIAYKHCKRFVGDFAELNKKQVAKAKEDAIAAAKLLATMSEAERRGLENKQRQEEDMKLEALIRKRNETSTEDLLSRISAGGGGQKGALSSSIDEFEALGGSEDVGLDDGDVVGLDAFAGDDGMADDTCMSATVADNDVDEDDIVFDSDDDARSESDASEGGADEAGHDTNGEREHLREEEELASKKRGREENNRRARQDDQSEEEEENRKEARAPKRHIAEATAIENTTLPAVSSRPAVPSFTAAPHPLSNNSFLASLGAVMGTNFRAPMPSAPQLGPSGTVSVAASSSSSALAAVATSVAGTTTPSATAADDCGSVEALFGSSRAQPPAKKKPAPKLKGKDFLNSYFNS